MMLGIKLNSFEYSKELFDILEDNFISEVHFFYDDYMYKDCLLSILDNKQSDKKCYIHINNIKELTIDDVDKFNERELIISLDYTESIISENYNITVLPYINKLIIDFHNIYQDIFDIRQHYKKISNYYYLRNYYFCNVAFDINNIINVDEYIKLYIMLRDTGMTNNIFGKSFLEKSYLNLLDNFKLMNDENEIGYIIPYNKFYYDINSNLLCYDIDSFKYVSLKDFYGKLFNKKDECINCCGNTFCPKYNVNCDVCKEFYSFFVNYILDMSEKTKLL